MGDRPEIRTRKIGNLEIDYEAASGQVRRVLGVQLSD